MRVSRFSEEEKVNAVNEWLSVRNVRSEREMVAAKYGVSEPTLYGWAAQLRRDGILPPRPSKPARGSRQTVGKLKAELAEAQLLIERLKHALRIARPFIPPGTPLG